MQSKDKLDVKPKVYTLAHIDDDKMNLFYGRHFFQSLQIKDEQGQPCTIQVNSYHFPADVRKFKDDLMDGKISGVLTDNDMGSKNEIKFAEMQIKLKQGEQTQTDFTKLPDYSSSNDGSYVVWYVKTYYPAIPVLLNSAEKNYDTTFMRFHNVEALPVKQLGPHALEQINKCLFNPRGFTAAKAQPNIAEAAQHKKQMENALHPSLNTPSTAHISQEFKKFAHPPSEETPEDKKGFHH